MKNHTKKLHFPFENFTFALEFVFLILHIIKLTHCESSLSVTDRLVFYVSSYIHQQERPIRNEPVALQTKYYIKTLNYFIPIRYSQHSPAKLPYKQLR